MIIQGQKHGELPPVGLVQMKELVNLISDTQFDVIVSSDIIRAYKSAAILPKKKKLTVTSTSLLRERDWDDFTGRYMSDGRRMTLQTICTKAAT